MGAWRTAVLPVFSEFPGLVSICSKLLSDFITPFVAKTNGDPVVTVGPYFRNQPVIFS